VKIKAKIDLQVDILYIKYNCIVLADWGQPKKGK